MDAPREIKRVTMDVIRIIHDKTELEGTCYFELLPGRYQRKCWYDNSVFFSEEIWGFLEPTIRRFESHYDHYAFIDVPSATWHQLIVEFRTLAERIRAAETIRQMPDGVGYFWAETKAAFAADFLRNRTTLAALFEEISDWLVIQMGPGRAA